MSGSGMGRLSIVGWCLKPFRRVVRAAPDNQWYRLPSCLARCRCQLWSWLRNVNHRDSGSRLVKRIWHLPHLISTPHNEMEMDVGMQGQISKRNRHSLRPLYQKIRAAKLGFFFLSWFPLVSSGISWCIYTFVVPVFVSRFSSSPTTVSFT